MGRKATVNTNLPNGIRARRRTRKNGKTVVYYFYDAGKQDGKRKEISLGTDYVLAVQKWAQIEVAKLPATGEATFNFVADRYEREIIANGKTSTGRQKRVLLKPLRQFFGNPDAPLATIEPQHIRQYLEWRKKTPGTANNEVRLFSHIFNCAREWGYINSPNPCLGVKKYPVRRRENYVEDHIYQLVYQAADPMLRDLMDVAYILGQRPIDVVKIHSNHISGNILHITQQKTGAKLRFEISGTLAQIIERRLPENGFLFRSNRGTALSVIQLGARFRKLRSKLIEAHPELEEDLQNFQFRDLRAKAATDIAMTSGVAAAAAQLGHASEQTTRRVYIRQAPLLTPLEPKSEK